MRSAFCRPVVFVAMFVSIVMLGATVQAAAPASERGHILVVPQGETGATIRQFVTTDDQPGKAGTTATVTWDDEAITFLIRSFDAKVIATHTKRDDSDIWRDDSVEIFLDPGHTHDPLSPWFHAIVSAAGGIRDERGPVTEWYSTGAVVSGDASFDASGMTAKVGKTKTGWIATIRIPWRDLGGPPKPGDVWGFNVNRTNHPEEEYLCYSPTRGPFYNINQWGHLAFADAKGGLAGMTVEQLTKQLDAMHEAHDTALTTVGGVKYDKLDPGAPFTRAPVPAQDWQAPEPSDAEKAAGLLAYVTSDPGQYKPDRKPKEAEHASRVEAFLTPGEDEPAWFGLRALAEVQGLTVRVDMGDAPVAVDVRYMHFWPQRTGWQSRAWYITPELLLPCAEGKMQVPTTRGLLEERAFDVSEGETAAFWLMLSAPADAKPGVYKGVIHISSAGRAELTLPLEIEVLPFALQRPTDRSWTLYCDQFRWNAMSDEQVMAELRDFARHGITGLNSIGLGRADLSDLKNGKVTFDVSSYERITTMAAAAGMPGPHVVRAWSATAVRDVVAPGVDLDQGDWPQAVKDGVAAVARAAMEATRDMPAWYYYGVDEPRGDNTFAIQDYQAWHAGGARTYATVIDTEFLEKAGDALTAPCFGTHLALADDGRAVREKLLPAGAEYWWYGTGSYVNPDPQEGMLYHNRFGSGVLLWKSGATGQAIWTYCRPHDDVFNDFDGSDVNRQEPKEQATVYPHLLKADDWSTYQGAIPTIAWEALREGTDDYAYLHTLKQTINTAMRHSDEAVRSEGKRSEAMMNALVDALPWADCMAEPAFETSRLRDLRRKVADEIVRLQALLAQR